MNYVRPINDDNLSVTTDKNIKTAVKAVDEQISIKDLNERLNYLGLDEKACATLRAAKPVLMEAMPSVLESFYKKLRAEPQMAKFFESEESISKAKSKQFEHWNSVTNGALDANYLAAVLRIGKVHELIGLEPHWYMESYSFILEELAEALVEAQWPKAFWSRKVKGKDVLFDQLGVLIRTAILDMELTVSVYLETLNLHSKQKDQKNKQVTDHVISTMKQVTDKLSQGDLTCRINEDFPLEYEELRQRFNLAVERLAGSMTSLHENSTSVNAAIHEISTASDDMSRRTEGQAASLEQSSAALNELTDAVRQTSEGLERLNDSVKAANQNAGRVSKIVSEAGQAMEQINESSRKIVDIIGLIDEIAFQTNLLALNAGVEAARAGDAGRGFAVVATEVRALAQRSADAAREIKTLISSSGEKVKQGVELVKKSDGGLKDIAKNIAEISELSSDISENSRGQSVGLSQINDALNAMGRDVQKNAAMAEQVHASVQMFEGEINALNNTIGSFKL